MLETYEINKALLRPMHIAGVEKRLMLANCLLCFPLVAVTHLRFPACLIGIVLFIFIHIGLRYVNTLDPHMGVIIKRATRFLWQHYYPPLSHPSHIARTVKSLP